MRAFLFMGGSKIAWPFLDSGRRLVASGPRRAALSDMRYGARPYARDRFWPEARIGKPSR